MNGLSRMKVSGVFGVQKPTSLWLPVLSANFLSPSTCPEIQGYLYMKEVGRKSWKKVYMFLRRSGLYCSTKGTSKEPRHLQLLADLEESSIFTVITGKKQHGAPTDYTFCIKVSKRNRVNALGSHSPLHQPSLSSAVVLRQDNQRGVPSHYSPAGTSRWCEEDGQVFLSLDDGVTKFTDLIQLVEFYQLNRGVLPCKLKHPCTVVAL
ncbi:hypothetical protein GOODEAATRI_017177 [Goodea atripinnis]|uniref:PH domain-containing protein n=1 Tax=Goodea atripinnis TaxID=208336 RepID=A0ABV0NL00_9TELE